MRINSLFFITRYIPFLFYAIITFLFTFAANSSASETNLMELSLEELIQIKVTTVSRMPEKLSDSPSAIQVITRDQIIRSGATNIPEALRLAGNLNIAQQNSSEWIISARGFSSDVGNKLLVMIDGRTVYTPLFSGVIWSRHNYLLEDIERIEVISGPGASLWGANAVNGVINIITRSANDTRGTYISGVAGTSLERLVEVRFGSKPGADTAYRIYGKAFERGPEYLSDGSDGNFSWQSAQVGFRMDSKLDSETSWTLQGDYFDNESDIASSTNSTVEGGNLLARWSHAKANQSNLTFQFYYDQTDLELPVAAVFFDTTELAPASIFYDKLDTIDFDFQHSILRWQGHRLIWGLGYRYTNNNVTNAEGLAFYPEHLEQDLYSAFIQDDIVLIKDKLKLMVGTKYEHNDYTGSEWEPSVRLQWFVDEGQLLWSSVSRAVRMPSRIDHDFSQPSREYLVILRGGEDFQSENVVAYELGYRFNNSDNMTTSLAGFYNEYTDIRSANLTPETFLPVFFENNLEGETWGIELSVNFQPTDWWQLDFAWAYLKEDMRVKEGEFDLNNALNETADPENQVSMHSYFEFSDSLSAYLGARWIDKLPINNNGEVAYVPAYEEVNIGVTWEINEEIDLSLNGRNLLHEHHQEFGVPSPTQEEVGRNIYLRLRWHN